MPENSLLVAATSGYPAASRVGTRGRRARAPGDAPGRNLTHTWTTRMPQDLAAARDSRARAVSSLIFASSFTTRSKMSFWKSQDSSTASESMLAG